MTTAILGTGDVNHRERGIGATIIARVDTGGRISMIGRTASVGGARAETVMKIGSVDIGLVAVGVGVRGAPEAERQRETGGRKSKPNHKRGNIPHLTVT